MMATGVNSVLNIGKGALLASQSALQVTGNNIANVDSSGYSRQAVRLEAWTALDYNPGQMGQGVQAVEVIRYFDKFIERNYLQKNSEYTRWAAMYSDMSRVESVFNESGGYGIGSVLDKFFASWEDLSQFPDDSSGRQVLVTNSQTLSGTIRSANQSLLDIEESVKSELREQVQRANQIMAEIAGLNKQINMHYVRGENNPNTLLDKRDALTRELSALIDVDVIDKGAGNYIVNARGGYSLVDGGVAYELSLDGPRVFQTKSSATTFNGGLAFDGSDGFEYTVEFVSGGAVGDVDPASGSTYAQFRVSLDGGKTWVTDAEGNEMHFDAYGADKPVRVKDLEIHFESNPDSSIANNVFIAGDRFTVVPKDALYWIEPTIGPLLITPQEMSDGSIDSHRANGGAISGNLLFLDYEAGKIHDQLDEFSKNLIWEVNRVHSQGAGLEKFSYALGDYRVRDSSFPLDALYSGLTWGDRLQAGSFSVALYDPLTGEPALSNPGMGSALSLNFDPGDSLDDLVGKLNSSVVTLADGSPHPLGDFLDISVVDNRLSIRGKDGYTFAFGDDTSGVLAALGINTYFKGESARNITLNETVAQNINFVNAGRVNGGGELNSGDNLTALEMGKLVDKSLIFTDWRGMNSTRSLSNYYASVVSGVGSEAAGANFYSQSTLAVARQLADTQDSISGVSLDEEMSNLIRFQASYKAAAKLITTADEMFQTLLGLKQ
ncbi:MAG: flagellar hook-associated protein FlgK [Deltaproteobacteria bacterium]|jgi:flagellar hook-associated protein 1 FlgK|nr:flagellar hook-associated protein FlgK [Deltaproteobacteria bacterium]